jgi:outer membrane protein, multidrug efflux system
VLQKPISDRPPKKSGCRRTLELATDRYTGGLENFLSVLDAQRALYAAEDTRVQSETGAIIATIAIFKAPAGEMSE